MHNATQSYLTAAQQIIERLRPYWPLTLRTVYYQMVSAGISENVKSQYQKLSRVLSQARHAGAVEWDAMEDRSRRLIEVSTWNDGRDFANWDAGQFLIGYNRDLLKSQPIRPEIWIEKDTLSHIVGQIAQPYCISVVIARGFCSTSFKKTCADRILANAANEQQTRILYLGDLDPSGWEMLEVMQRQLYEDFDLTPDQVTFERLALNPEQVSEYKLPDDPTALKSSDSRSRKYVQRFGNVAVELDALDPEDLQRITREGIESCIDRDLFEDEELKQESERAQLRTIRSGLVRSLEQAVMAMGAP